MQGTVVCDVCSEAPAFPCIPIFHPLWATQRPHPLIPHLIQFSEYRSLVVFIMFFMYSIVGVYHIGEEGIAAS